MIGIYWSLGFSENNDGIFLVFIDDQSHGC